MSPFFRSAVAASIWVLLALAWPAMAQDDPRSTRVEESVDVRLVLVEVLVTDRAGRTVPDLNKDDFTLLVDFKPVPIDVLDIVCDAGALDDPLGGQRGKLPDPPRSLEPRRFVIALDWMNSPSSNRPFMLGAVERLIRDRKTPYDEVMVVVIADGLQIVQTFTRDDATLLAALDAIEMDARIWAQPTFAPLTPRPYFEALSRLMDVLEQYDGAKAVVLMSDLGGYRDPEDSWFFQVAHRAAESRTAIYPVSARGLQAGRSVGPIGGSPGLSRLANESGGRYTRGTNDLSLAFARAQRDLACRYTLGFYLQPDEDSGGSRKITVRMNRGGLTARAPERMSSWTEQERRRAASLAAFLDPARLDDGSMRARAQSLAPLSRGTWQTAVALEYPKPAARDGADPAAEVGILISRLGRSRRAVDRVVPSSTGTAGTGRERDTLVEHFELETGRWSVTAVLTDPLDDRIRTTTTELVVPGIPEEEGPFVVGPVLGTAGPSTRADRRAAASFESSVDTLVRPGGTASMLSHVCRFDPWPERTRFTVQRAVLDGSGSEAARLEPTEVDLSGWRALQCRAVLDRIPTKALSPGDYRFEVRIDDDGRHATAARGFRLTSGEPD